MVKTEIAAAIVKLSEERGRDKTVCPSEVARQLWPEDWRNYMEEVRKIAFELRDAGKVIITQRGVEVLGNKVSGPIRIRIV